MLMIMQNIKLCKTCGHSNTNHQNNKCNFTIPQYALQCPCIEYIEVEISDKRQLGKEFDEAWEAYKKFIQSCKGTDGVYKIPDFKKAILIHTRQDHLWRELTQK